MFLVKSTFWLGLAFIVIQPMDIDLKASAQSASKIATNAGTQIIIQQLTSNQCDNMQCNSSKILTLASSSIANEFFKKDNTNQQSITSLPNKNIPTPRPRLKRDS